ncbi:MAG: hypothetical protein F4X64_01095 [Chloroflexi bacterium]|nr:hypothetical protein [Chloroflexota bacterium]
MSQNSAIRDLIYFDFDKTTSIASQLEDGLRKEIQDTYTESTELGGGFDLKILNVGGKESDSREKLVTKSVHHDLLVRVEENLLSKNYAIDVNAEFTSNEDAVSKLHQAIKERPYVRVEGTCRFHDFGRIKSLVNGLNDIVDFLEESARAKIMKSDEYSQAKLAIERGEVGVAAESDRNKKSKGKRAVKRVNDQLEEFVNQAIAATVMSRLPEWQVCGISNMIDLLWPNRNILLLQPFEDNSQLEFISNLKSDCFVDSDPDNLLFAYSSQPDIPLTVFGLATAIPGQDKSAVVNPSSGASTATSDSIKQLETLFEGLFNTIQPIESLGRFSYFPRVTVFPLAVYSTLKR